MRKDKTLSPRTYWSTEDRRLSVQRARAFEGVSLRGADARTVLAHEGTDGARRFGVSERVWDVPPELASMEVVPP